MRQGYSLLTSEVFDTYEISDGWLPTLRPNRLERPWPASDPYGGLFADAGVSPTAPSSSLPSSLGMSGQLPISTTPTHISRPKR